MSTSRTVTLIGLMGAGKTEVGERVAARLGRPFFDTDALVEAAAGRRIAEIFGEDGEESFRILEAEAIRKAMDQPRAVVAVGGGAVMRRDNVVTLRSAGDVLWLHAPPETLATRLQDSAACGDRPLLAGTDVKQRLMRLLDQRRSAYAKAASAVLETDGLDVHQVAELVIDWIRSHAGGQAAGDWGGRP